jgi:drug/metabolite transporter (DMT)-like permease
MTPLEWAMLLALSVVWGGSFFFVGIAVKELPPLTIVALRTSLAAILLWLAAPALGFVMPRRREALVAFLVMGLLNNAIPFCLIVWGQTQLASGLASILNATTPLFTVLAGHFLSADDRMTPPRLAGALCGLFGVAVMIGPQLVEGLGSGVLAELAILGAAVSYAFASLFGRRFRRLGIDPIATATGQVTASSLMLVPIALIVDRPWTLPMPGAATIAAIAAIASLSTALAYILYFRILAGAGATNVVLVTLLAPVSSILLGAIFLHEHLEIRHFLGLALIGLGLACIDGRLLKVFRLAKSP